MPSKLSVNDSPSVSKPRSDTVWMSLIGARAAVTVLLMSVMLRCEKYGSLCGWRLSCWQMPA